MSTATTVLKFALIASDSASKPIKGVGTASDDTGSKLSKMKTVGTAAVLGLAGAAVGFATSSINKFKQVTIESRGLQRAMGGTLEQASRWREAAVLSGVDSGTFLKSVQKLDKGLVASTKSSKLAAAMTQTLGFKYTDAHGKILPMSTLLPKISDKFAAMPDGAEKTALAMQLFGKAGNAMLPMLSKGSAGISDLMKQSDKFGTTLSNDAVDKLSASKTASREFAASLDGLKVTIGAQLLPMITNLVTFISSHVMPIIEAVTGFIKQHSSAVAFAAITIATLVVGIKAWAIAQAFLNFVMEANPIMLVVTAIAALAAGFVFAWNHCKTFRDIIKGVFHVVAVAFDFVKAHWGLLLAVFTGGLSFVAQHWRAVWGGVKAIAADIVQWVKNLGGWFVWLWNHSIGWLIDKIHTGFQIAVALIRAEFNAIGSAIRTVGGWFTWLWDHSIGWLIGKIHSGFDFAVRVVGGAFGAIIGAVKTIGKWFAWLWNNSIGWVIGKITAGIGVIKSAIAWAGRLAGNLNGVNGSWNMKAVHAVDNSHHATGGSVGDGFFTTGEHGPETGYKSGNNVMIWPHGYGPKSAGHQGGHGDTINLTVNGAVGSPQAVARMILTELQRLKGAGTQLNLA